MRDETRERLTNRDEKLHLVLEGVVKRHHLRRQDVFGVSVQGKQAAEPQHMPKGAPEPLT